MAIVTQNYYNNTYLGGAVATDDFARLDARAEDIVALATRNAVNETNITELPELVQKGYKYAICSQIEYFNTYGVDVAITGITGASFTVGKVSVNDGEKATGKATMLCPAALNYLEQTGLLDRNVGLIGEPFLPFWYGGALC